MRITGRSLIGWGEGTPGGKRFHGCDPARGVELAPAFASATGEDVTRAVELARAAAPIVARKTGAERAALLQRVAEKLEANGAVLAERAAQETALAPGRCESEIARTAGQLRLYGAEAAQGDWLDARIETAQPDRQPTSKPDHRSMLRPLGPVVVFGASNFPFAYSVAGGDTASALAAGCPVIVKAHPAHPGTGELVGRLVVAAVRECGWPEGTFSLLFDAGFEVGQALVKHAAVQAVGFTGSLRGGRALADLAAARAEPIPVYAEMGSVNPVFVRPGAIAEHGAELAEQLHASATLAVGQFCTNPGVIVVERSAAAEVWVRQLAEKLEATAPATMLTPGMAEKFWEGVAKRAQSARTVVGEKAREKNAGTGATARPVWFETDAVVFARERGLSEEIFGPSAVVVWCRDHAEMLDVARHLEGSLTATLLAGAAEAAGERELIEVLASRAGRVILNGFPTGLEVSHAIVHGGPYPATSDGGRSTSVGTRALQRWTRLVCYQNFADELLPVELQNANPRGLLRRVNGEWTRGAVR
ncbi:aldehyde dehydrogenase (NADP(+)) [Horticoccus luteus]|uniref:Aldehyde dehydrogenase (NADP(+)) n=1 Tax=Horticoccus luteus TaxID=2862869 RepID=A0A8F9TX66_9BACT|nr:aldehyde dehydrogenase (NADP(+)) [Horticoccus luteus]QYM79677.1 aldehyde dehydrogenase (NADP(+)) [Horticoccus luteus]